MRCMFNPVYQTWVENIQYSGEEFVFYVPLNALFKYITFQPTQTQMYTYMYNIYKLFRHFTVNNSNNTYVYYIWRNGFS